MLIDIDCQSIIQDVEPITFYANRRPQTVPGIAPDHRRVFVGHQQPRYAHKRYRREAHVSCYHHLVALNAVQELPVEPAQNCRNRERNYYRRRKAYGFAPRVNELLRKPRQVMTARKSSKPRHYLCVPLYGESCAEKAGNYAQRKAEVQPAPRLDHRDHSQHHNAVHSEAHERVA